MIHFGLSSVLMTVLVSNLLLVVISLLFCSEKILERIGFRLTAIFCIITLIRLLLPLELPFAKTVIYPAAISNAISKVRHLHNVFPGLWISIWYVFCLVWLAGSVYRLSKLLYGQHKVRMLVREHSKDVTKQEPYASILKDLCTERQRRTIRLLTTKFVNVPMIMGLRNALILLPADIDTSDEDIMFALRHEVYHYVHHDLWLKFAVNCLAAVYWWNPFTHLLNKRISVLLEMRVDDSIISEGEDTFIGYLSSMLHYMEEPSQKEDSSQYTGLALKKKSNLARRLHMMQSKGKKHDYLLSAMMVLIVGGIYIGSYSFILENSNFEQNITESDRYTTPRDDDCFAIQNDDGTYTIYLPSLGIDEVVDSLELYPKIKVYSSKEDYNEAIQNP